MVAKHKLLREKKVSASLNLALDEHDSYTEMAETAGYDNQLKVLPSLPFIIFLFGSALYLPKFIHGGLVSPNIDDGGIFRQVFFGLSYLLAAFSLWRNMRLVVPLVMQQWLNLVLLLVVLGSALWSVAPGKVLINFGHLSGAFLVALTMGFNFCHSPLRFFRILALLELIILGVSIFLALVLPAYGQILIGDTMRWSGIGTHPNQLGISGAIGIWAALALFKESVAPRDKKLALSVFIAGWVVIIGANSITSLFVAITLLGWFLYIGTTSNRKSAVLRVMIGIFGLLILMLVIHVVAPDILGLHTIFGAAGRSENLSGRTELWVIARQAIEVHPIFGWSFDSLISLESKFGIAYGQFHNGYLDLLVRGGALALGVVVVIIVRGIFSGYRNWSTFQAVAVPGLGMCVFAILHNITEASLVRPTHPLWVMLLAVIIALNACDKRLKNHNPS